jgi:xanthine/uracil/vitamin C permease (AzgA family)
VINYLLAEKGDAYDHATLPLHSLLFLIISQTKNTIYHYLPEPTRPAVGFGIAGFLIVDG